MENDNSIEESVISSTKSKEFSAFNRTSSKNNLTKATENREKEKQKKDVKGTFYRRPENTTLKLYSRKTQRNIADRKVVQKKISSAEHEQRRASSAPLLSRTADMRYTQNKRVQKIPVQRTAKQPQQNEKLEQTLQIINVDTNSGQNVKAERTFSQKSTTKEKGSQKDSDVLEGKKKQGGEEHQKPVLSRMQKENSDALNHIDLFQQFLGNTNMSTCYFCSFNNSVCCDVYRTIYVKFMIIVLNLNPHKKFIN